MKTRHTFLLLILLTSSTVTYSQLTTSLTQFKSKKDIGNVPDTVTVGSIMPYKVSPYNWGTLSKFMNPSIYKWWLNGNATGYQLRKIDGINPLTPLPPPNHVYYNDSAIAIQWIKTGAYTIRVSEKSVPKIELTGCNQAESIQTLDVVVISRPAINWRGPATTGGCNLANTTQNIPVDITGALKTTITYDLIYTPQEGTPVTQTDLQVSFNNTKPEETFQGNIEITIPEGKYGTYEIAIKSITDKVSAKCGVKTLPADYPANNYVLVVLPEPETSPIEFIGTVK